MKMTRKQMNAEIDQCMKWGYSISSIAFRLMQYECELIAKGDEQIELREMERMWEVTKDAFDDEIGALKGVHRVYMKAEGTAE